MKTILFAFLIIISVSIAQGQSNCEKLVKWTDQLKQEFPGLDMNSIRHGSQQETHIVSNLYSDRFFVPIFGKPFDELSESKRLSLYKQMSNCNQKPQYGKSLDFHCTRLLYPFYATAGDKSISNIEKMAKTIREYRLLYDVYANKLITPNGVTFEEIEDIEADLETDFLMLLPSEIKQMETWVSNAKNQMADGVITKELDALVALPNTANNLHNVVHFISWNSEAYKYANAATKLQVEQVLKEKADAILKLLMPEEMKKLNLIGTNMYAFEKMISWHGEFLITYKIFETNQPVKEVLARFEQVHVQALKANREAFTKELGNDSLNGLDKLSAKYMLNMHNHNPTVAEFVTMVDNKKAALLATKKRNEDIKNKAQEDSLAFAKKRIPEISTLSGTIYLEDSQWEEYYHGKWLSNIFHGEFEEFLWDETFKLGFVAYIFAYSDYFMDHLPAGSEKMVWNETTTTYNGWGFELYKHTEHYKTLVIAPEFKTLFKPFVGELTNMVSDKWRIAEMYNEMRLFASKQTFDSAILKQMTANMLRFAQKQPSLQQEAIAKKGLSKKYYGITPKFEHATLYDQCMAVWEIPMEYYKEGCACRFRNVFNSAPAHEYYMYIKYSNYLSEYINGVKVTSLLPTNPKEKVALAVKLCLR